MVVFWKFFQNSNYWPPWYIFFSTKEQGHYLLGHIASLISCYHWHWCSGKCTKLEACSVLITVTNSPIKQITFLTLRLAIVLVSLFRLGLVQLFCLCETEFEVVGHLITFSVCISRQKWQICPEMHIIRCMPFTVSITKCAVALLVNFTITSGEKYGQYRS